MSSLIPPDRLADTDLSKAEKQRYARHLTIPDVGMEGQKRLKAARVLCVGAGGLGSPVTMYLAAAGIGEIGLVDFDRVDFSNLQRQILHDTGDVGKLKTESAVERLGGINPEVNVTTYEEAITDQNAAAIAEPYDLIIDGTDNFTTRYLTNDLAVLTGKPNVYGSIYRFEGQVSVFAPHLGGPCYRCLFPEPPEPGQVPSCAEGGVLGVLPGIVGCLQANEAIKLILGIGDPMIGRLLHFDALSFRFREIKLRRDPECAVCGEKPTIQELKEIVFNCDMSDLTLREIDVHQLKARLDDPKPFVLLDVREPAEVEVGKIEQSIVIPLGELPDRIGELDPGAETIIHCKVGGRSAKALAFLNESGFTKACHVQGGITAWAREIDPRIEVL
ncbi:MAG: molybdopterin-synthase adenylyltransferase MoeB [Verrucomicrobiales bacterium]|nr:molybdopterin-synthase adenylyltransferase MoeB [Verrucomicrobiales bacterium]